MHCRRASTGIHARILVALALRTVTPFPCFRADLGGGVGRLLARGWTILRNLSSFVFCANHGDRSSPWV